MPRGGKKKTKEVDQSNPEAVKEQGNKAFMAGDYQEAIKQYSTAIELTFETPSPIYFANRANAYLELHNYEECIIDCNKAIEIDATFVKSHYRRAKALWATDKIEEAAKSIQKACELDADNADYMSMRKEILEDLEIDNRLAHDHPERLKFQNLIDWMIENGAKFPKLKMRYYSENYRGVHALTEVNRNETILYVPLEMLITLEMAFASPIGKQMYERGLRSRLISPKHTFLGTYIMQERRNPKGSMFQKYLDILPKDITEFPVFFSEEDKEWLNGSRFKGMINDKIDEIKKDYDLVCSEVPEFAQFPLEEYTELRMIVASRIFGITIDGVKTDAFVPYADMLNHKRPRETSWYYSDEKKGFVIETCEDLPRGAPIHDSYGKKCNSRFFLNYGFINMNNDANEIQFRVELSVESPAIEGKLKLLNNKHIVQFFKVTETLKDEVCMNFMSFVRLVTFEEDVTHLFFARNEKINEVKRRRAANRKVMDSDSETSEGLELDDVFKGHNVKYYDVKSETKMWQEIKNMATAQYEGYATTLEEDTELLANDDKETDQSKKLTQNQRNCVLYRHGEKEILTFWIDTADLMMRWMTCDHKTIQTELKHSNRYHLINDYVVDTLQPMLKGVNPYGMKN